MNGFIKWLAVTTALIAFASNSLLCRAALKNIHIDAISFTSIRLISGAVVLLLLVSAKRKVQQLKFSFDLINSLALLSYAFTFSIAYINMSAASGALLLFSSVQFCMLGYALWSGERMNRQQIFALCASLLGLVGLLLPGAESPPLFATLLMIFSGISWAVYSLRGRFSTSPILNTSANFLIAAVLSLVFVIFKGDSFYDTQGVWLAFISGGLTSGLGYVVWYQTLPLLKSTQAAIVQVSVPAIAALGGVLFLGESLSERLMICSLIILSGICVFIYEKNKISK
jgi:drug/metabolite transporter (DMT)-like permease